MGGPKVIKLGIHQILSERSKEQHSTAQHSPAQPLLLSQLYRYHISQAQFTDRIHSMTSREAAEPPSVARQ